MLSETQPNNNVVDFMERKLMKQLEDTSTAFEFEVASALLELYLTDQINVTMQDGKLLFESKELFETEESVHIPVDPWSWVDDQS